jgi:hypothetical protein
VQYICLPAAVREVGNHFIWEMQRGTTLNVPVSTGFLHHYRICEFGGTSPEMEITKNKNP